MPTENPFEALGRNPIINAAANQKLDDTAASETRHMRRSAHVLRQAAISILREKYPQMTEEPLTIPDANYLTRFRQMSLSERAETYGLFQDVQGAMFFEYVIAVVRSKYNKDGQDAPLSHNPRPQRYGETKDDLKFNHGSFIPVIFLCIDNTHELLKQCKEARRCHKNIHGNVIGLCVDEFHAAFPEDRLLPCAKAASSGTTRLNHRSIFREMLVKSGLLRSRCSAVGPYDPRFHTAAPASENGRRGCSSGHSDVSDSQEAAAKPAGNDVAVGAAVRATTAEAEVAMQVRLLTTPVARLLYSGALTIPKLPYTQAAC